MKPFSDVALLTPRLRLRPLAVADAESLYRIYSDPEFMRYWSSAPWTSMDQVTQLIERDLRELAAGEHVRLGIFLRDGDGLIGTCSPSISTHNAVVAKWVMASPARTGARATCLRQSAR